MRSQDRISSSVLQISCVSSVCFTHHPHPPGVVQSFMHVYNAHAHIWRSSYQTVLPNRQLSASLRSTHTANRQLAVSLRSPQSLVTSASTSLPYSQTMIRFEIACRYVAIAGWAHWSLNPPAILMVMEFPSTWLHHHEGIPVPLLISGKNGRIGGHQ